MSDEELVDIVLYESTFSICCQMVRLVLVEKQLSYRTVQVDLARAEQYEDWFLEFNPNGQVPALSIGSQTLAGTQAICQKLDALFEGPQLQGKSSNARKQDGAWQERALGLPYADLLFVERREEDGSCAPLLARQHKLEERLAAAPTAALQARLQANLELQQRLRKPGHLDDLKAIIGAELAALEQHLSEQPYVGGRHYCISDCLWTPALSRLRAQGLAPLWQELHGVADYIQRMQIRPSFRQARLEPSLAS